MVILAEPVSGWIAKGEVVDRYLNPGDYFDEVHLVTIGEEGGELDLSELQRMAGRASVQVHSYPAGRRLFLRSWGWRPRLLEGWARPVVELTRRLAPDVVRCHGAHLNAYLALTIKRTVGTPYVISMHINPAEDLERRPTSVIDLVATRAIRSVARAALREADLVLPVYRSILPYLEDIGVPNVEVAYNMINPTELRAKDDFALHQPVRLVSVGRQIPAKNPENVIRALRLLPDAELTLVGDGPLHEHLKAASRAEGLESRVEFKRSIPNNELCRILPDFDIFVTHTQYWEISKSVLEALLTGLPVVLNRRSGAEVPELDGEMCEFVPDTLEGYATGLRKLIDNDDLRRSQALRARERARTDWDPKRTEQRFVELYQRVLGSGT